MSFAGATADHYARHRRGYPPPVLDQLLADLRIDQDATVLDLGCGTGLLTVPLGDRVRLAVGADPEPDMLRHAPRTPNTAWLVAGDQDLPVLAKLFRPDALTIAQALHLMDVDAVLDGAASLVGGRLAIIANGLPVWQQDTEWSRILLRHVQAQLGPTSGAVACGTSTADRAAYRQKLLEHGYTDIVTSEVTREHPISTDEVIGGFYSALDPESLPRWAETEDSLRSDLDALGLKTEQVTVHILSATVPQGASREYSSSSTGRPSP